MSNEYSYPLLKSVEISAFLREVGLSVKEKELQNPTPEMVTRIYEVFVELLMGATREDLITSTASVRNEDHLGQHPELHEESSIQELMFRAIQTLMETCGVSDFTIRDLIAPEPKRTRSTLSAVVNFARFREEHMEKYRELLEGTEGLVSRKQILQARLADVNEEVGKYRAEKAAQQPEVDIRTHELSALNATIDKLHEEQHRLQLELRSVKEENLKLEEEHATIEKTLQQESRELGTLRDAYVPEPEVLHNHVVETENRIEQVKVALEESQRKAREFMVKVESLNKVHEDLQNVLVDMTNTENTIKATHEAERSVEASQEECERLQQQVQETQQKAVNSKRMLSNYQKKIYRAQEKGTTRQETLQSKLQDVQAENQSLIEEEAFNRQKGVELESKANQIRDNTARERERRDAEVEEMKKSVEELSKSVRAYHNSISGHLQVHCP
eukprot:Clim_evm11s32 gene=Clim_evmTU11s32